MVEHNEKPALRKHYRALRSAISSRAEKADDLALHFLAQHFLKGIKTVAVCASMPEEIDTLPLIKKIRHDGFSTAYPYTKPDGTLGFRLVSDEAHELAAHSALPIYEPKADLPDAEPELILLPLVAFDGRGARLGMGGGYYDRTIAFLRTKGRMPLCVGLAFEQQRCETNLPVESHDMFLDAVVTEACCHDFRK